MSDNDKIRVWIDYLNKVAQEMETTDGCLRFVYADELIKNGLPLLPDWGSQLHLRVREEFKHDKFSVITHTLNRYGDEDKDRYFRLQMKEMPRGISMEP